MSSLGIFFAKNTKKHTSNVDPFTHERSASSMTFRSVTHCSSVHGGGPHCGRSRYSLATTESALTWQKEMGWAPEAG